MYSSTSVLLFLRVFEVFDKISTLHSSLTLLTSCLWTRTIFFNFSSYFIISSTLLFFVSPPPSFIDGGVGGSTVLVLDLLSHRVFFFLIIGLTFTITGFNGSGGSGGSGIFFAIGGHRTTLQRGVTDPDPDPFQSDSHTSSSFSAISTTGGVVIFVTFGACFTMF